MSSPDIVLLSIRIISRPHVGQVVSDARTAGLRLNHEGNFICDPFRS